MTNPQLPKDSKTRFRTAWENHEFHTETKFGSWIADPVKIEAFLAAELARKDEEKAELIEKIISWISQVKPSEQMTLDETLQKYGTPKVRVANAAMVFVYDQLTSLLDSLGPTPEKEAK